MGWSDLDQPKPVYRLLLFQIKEGHLHYDPSLAALIAQVNFVIELLGDLMKKTEEEMGPDKNDKDSVLALKDEVE